jgi:hypothetical protein
MVQTIKWISSVLIIISMILTASGDYHPWNLYIAVPATIGWVIVSFCWRDKSLILMNTIALTIYLLGITKHITG